MRKPMTFVVKIVPPPKASARDVRQHIIEAIDTWPGQYHPEHPMRWLTSEDVKVRRAGLGVSCPMCGHLSERN